MDISTIEEAEKAEKAFYEYMALPDADAIVSRMHLVDSADKAVNLIQAARFKAWSIREEMASGLSGETLTRLHKAMREHVGKLSYEVATIHPLVGPLQRVRYPGGINAAMIAEIRREIEKEEQEKRENQLREARKAGAMKALKATSSRERKLFVQGVKDYVEWARQNRGGICLATAHAAPSPKRINKQRFSAFLRLLIQGLENPQSSQAILGELDQIAETHTKRHKGKHMADEPSKEVRVKLFENVTEDTVDECLEILRKEKCTEPK